MFRRKDEDIAQDLLSETEENTVTNNDNTTPEASEGPKVTTTTSSTGAATPSTGGYTRPDAPANRAATGARPSNFRPGGGDFNRNRPASASSNAAVADKPKTSSKRVLTVGNDILLKGEIATCDRLVIEGAVDATLKEVHTVEIAQNGSFKGNAEIEDAEISGLFEGELVVRNRLVIYATGEVRGKITYGEIEIERGGQMTGEIKSFDSKTDAKSKDDKSAKKAA